MEILGKLRWQTQDEAQMHYVSTLLGWMQGKEFEPLYPGAPGEWPDEYLESVISHIRSHNVMRMQQKKEAERLNKKSKTPDMPEAQKQMLMQREKAYHMARQGQQTTNGTATAADKSQS